MAGWPSGLRRWFKAPVTSVARVRISLLSLGMWSFSKAIPCEENETELNMTQHTTYDGTEATSEATFPGRRKSELRQDGRVV